MTGDSDAVDSEVREGVVVEVTTGVREEMLVVVTIVPDSEIDAGTAEVASDSSPGSTTLGTVALDEVSATRGKSKLLSVVVATVPADVSVMVSKLTDVTKLVSGPAVSILFTKESISKPGLTANIMPRSQWDSGRVW
jgi:hypothetical protein